MDGGPNSALEAPRASRAAMKTGLDDWVTVLRTEIARRHAPAPHQPAPPTEHALDPMDQLKELAELHDPGIVSDESSRRRRANCEEEPIGCSMGKIAS
jgi:hypothetical protein